MNHFISLSVCITPPLFFILFFLSPRPSRTVSACRPDKQPPNDESRHGHCVVILQVVNSKRSPLSNRDTLQAKTNKGMKVEFNVCVCVCVGEVVVVVDIEKAAKDPCRSFFIASPCLGPRLILMVIYLVGKGSAFSPATSSTAAAGKPPQEKQRARPGGLGVTENISLESVSPATPSPVTPHPLPLWPSPLQWKQRQ